MKNLLHCLLMVIFPLIVHGAIPPHINLTTLNGLPGNEAYYCTQDSKGYIWIATANGLCRFDGTDFYHFTDEDELLSEEIIEVHADRQGRVWLFTISGKIGYWFEGEFFSEQKDPALRFLQSDWMSRVFHEDVSKNVWIGNWRYGFNSYKSAQGWKTINKEGCFAIAEDSQGKMFFISKYDVQSLEGDIVWNHGLQIGQNARFAISGDDNLICIDQSQIAILNLRDRKVSQVEANPLFEFDAIYRLIASKDGRFIAATANGLFLFDIVDNKQEGLQHYFPGIKISNVFEDRERNIWLTTLRNGVYFVIPNSLSIRNYTSLAGANSPGITTISVTRDYVTLSFSGKVVLLDRKDGTSRLIYSFEDDVSEIRKTIRLEDHLIVASNRGVSLINGGSIRNYQAKFGEFDKLYSVGTAKDLFLTKDTLYTATIYGLFRFEDYRSNFVGEKLIGGRINAALQDKSSQIWVGTEDALLRIERDSIYKIADGNFRSLVQSDDGTIWAGTYGKGIFYHSSEIEKEGWIDASEGLPGNICTDIEEHKGVIWATVVGGLAKIEHFKIVDVATIMDGLPTNEFSSIDVENDTIWLGYTGGYCMFNYNDLNHTYSAPSLYLKAMQIGAKDTLIQDNLDFPYWQNDLGFRFAAVSFHSHGNIIYEYRINDGLWVNMPGGRLNLSKLQPANYSIQVRAKGYKTPWSQPVLVEFSILPPFWQTWWFRGGLFALVILAIYFFFKIRVLTYNRDLVRELILIGIKRLKREKYFYVKRVTDGANVKIVVNEIFWIKASRNYCEIATENGTYVVRGNIKSMEEKIRKEGYADIVRVHRSYMVNRKQITGINGTTLLVKENEVPVGRLEEYRQHLRELHSKLNKKGI